MSAAPAKPADPSMEEILASIRRIIADDDETPAAPGSTVSATAGSGERASPATGPGQGQAEHEDDDVLDLAEMPDATRTPETSLEIEMPDLSFQESRAPSSPLPASPASQAPPRTVAPEPAPAPASPETIVSPTTTASVSHAFNILSHTIMSQNAHTLEDVVREMLRPMLKSWLDDNLPPLVERLVAQEIQRVARGQR